MIDNYADFAELYDDTISTDNPTKIALLRSLIERHNPAANTLLEAACGTGAVLQGFSDFSCTGFDLSPNMLTVASSKLPEVTFLQGDMTDFDLGQQFDVVLCIFNSINHLLAFADWRRTFACVAQHLGPSGIFIFDANTVSYPERRVGLEGVIEHSGHNEVLATMKWQRTGVYEWHINIIDEAGHRHDIVVPEAVFPLEQIETALNRHFTILEKVSGNAESADEDTDRVYYVCRPRLV